MKYTFDQTQLHRIEMVVSSTGNRIKNIKAERYKRHIPLNRGEIWTCDFGQNVGGEISGIRPCLVIQNDTANKKSRNTIVLPIKVMNNPKENHVCLEESDIEFATGVLGGVVITDQIQVISKARLGRMIAKLSDTAMSKISDAIRKVLGL